MPSAIAQTVTVTNVFENHYNNFPPIQTACGATIPSGQYPTTYHLERGHYIHHYDPNNASNDYWVYWAHFDNSSYTIAEVAVFKSTTQCGPYILQTNLYTGSTPSNVTDPNQTYNTDGSGYGFAPGGWQSRDENIFADTATQTYNADGSVAHYADAYLYTASDSQNTIPSNSCGYANDSIAAFHMTQDYMHIDTTTSPSTNGANWIFPCAQREAPVLFRNGSYYFLIVSQAAGWYPSQGAYGSSANPLTGFQASPLTLGNTSTFGGQTADGFVIAGSQANTYVLDFDHLGGSDSKNPANSGSGTDSGFMYLPVILNGSTGTATLNWESSWSVNMATGVLTLPTTNNLGLSGTATATVTSAAASGTTTYVPGNAIDGLYSTRWQDTLTGSSSFATAKPTGATLCPQSNATASTTCYPSLVVDLGSVQPVQELDLSTYMVHGSEAYYTYKVEYSSDNINWTTLDYTAFAPQSNATTADIAAIPFSNPIEYGFNALPVNFSARYVALSEYSVVQQNSTSPFYGPNAFEFAVIQSTAPATPLPVNVSVVPSSTDVSASSSFTVTVTVTDPSGTASPSGYVQLSNANYISNTYGLANGSATFKIPAGALPGGNQTLTVSYRADTTGAPVYGIGTTSGTAQVFIDVPAAPAAPTVTAVSPQALGISWTAVTGATGYTLYSSSNGGSTYIQLTTTTATTYTNTELTNGNTYCYEVAATNASGASAPSASTCATATNNFPVTNLAVNTGGPSALTVSFTAVANATSYTIQRAVGSSTTYTTLASPTTTSYIDSGLTNGIQYCYEVQANFSTGSGAFSSPVCATATTATPPLSLSVTPWASGQLFLSWLVNGNGTTYVIQRNASGGAYSTLVSSQATLNYVNTSLTNGTTYCYEVAETYNGVTSSYSAPVCAAATGTFITVPNYSFETPAVGLWSTQPSALNPTGSWTFVGNSSNSGDNSGVSNISATFTGSPTPTAPTPLGNQVGLLEGTGTLTQTISGLTVGQVYTVLVNAMQRQQYTYQTAGANPFSIIVGGTALGNQSPPQNQAYYRDYGASFKATSTSVALQLAGTASSGSAAVLLDNVRIYANPSAATGTYATPNYVWLGNSNGTLVRSTEQGAMQSSGMGTSSSTTTSYAGIAVDSNGGIWSVNSGNNLINYIASATAAQAGNYSPATFTDSSLSGPSSVAIDGGGTVWITNLSSPALSTFGANGSLKGTVSDSSLQGASSLAVDISGNVWVTNSTGNTVDEVIGAAIPTMPLAPAISANAPASKP